MKKLLQILGVIFLILVVLAIGSLIAFRVAFKKYEEAEEFCVKSSRAEVMKAIDSINDIGGGTNTAEAITNMDHQMFSQKSGARPNVPRIAVVITDGRSSNPTNTAAAANQARADHIGMMSVGIGAGVDQSELHAISDNPDSENSFMVNNYDQLSSITSQIIQKACRGMNTYLLTF